jgi:nucleoporin NDC1
MEVAKPVELIKKPTILQSGAVKQSLIRRVLEGLGSDGVLVQALDEGAEKGKVNVGMAIPTWSVLHSPGKENMVVKSVVQVKSNAAGKSSKLPTRVEAAVCTVYEKWVPPQGTEPSASLWKWWAQKRLSKHASLPNREFCHYRW